MATLNALFCRRSACRTAIGWTLLAALLLLALVPFHYHLHHGDVPAAGSPAHEHTADIHLHADAGAAAHHDSGHTLDPAPDVTVKNAAGGQLPIFAALLALCIVLPLAGRTFCYARLAVSHRLPRCYRHTTPPLRAPPRG